MTVMRRLAGILLSALREIFDEAAYSRFLERTHSTSSPAAYEAFWREREKMMPKPRCC